MASFDSLNYAKKIAVPSQKIPVGQEKGTEFCMYDEYTSLAALTAADVIKLGITIPKGCIVSELIVISPAGGGTVDVGIVGSTTKYAAAAAQAATTAKYPLSTTTADEDLIATIGGAPAAAGKYQFLLKCIKY